MEKKKEIHIAFGLHDKYGTYSVWVGTTMLSIIENTTAPICFHIVHDETLSTENKEKLMQLAEAREKKVVFYQVKERLNAISPERVAKYTIGTMFRLLIPELVPELKRIIYLDADLLVNRDIKELWDMDIEEYYLAAVLDMGLGGGTLPYPVRTGEVEKERYFNAGVLYMNLECLRKMGNMCDLALDYFEKTPSATLLDQDFLNTFYNKKTLLLDSTWNFFTRFVQRTGEELLEQKIYHFAREKFRLTCRNEIELKYFQTIESTPWGKKECERILLLSFERPTDRIGYLQQLLCQISGKRKKYIFYGSETFAMKNLYRLISVQDGDYRVLENVPNESGYHLPCKPLTELAKEQKGDFIVFVLPEADNGKSMRRLEEMGLKNGTDYFVIQRLLIPPQGGYV